MSRVNWLLPNGIVVVHAATTQPRHPGAASSTTAQTTSNAAALKDRSQNRVASRLRLERARNGDQLAKEAVIRIRPMSNARIRGVEPITDDLGMT